MLTTARNLVNGSQAKHSKDHIEIQTGKGLASDIEYLYKSIQRRLRFGRLRPGTDDYGESVTCLDGVDLVMKLFALVGKD